MLIRIVISLVFVAIGLISHNEMWFILPLFVMGGWTFILFFVKAIFKGLF